MASIRKDEVQEIIADIREMLELRGDPPESELKRLAQRYTTTIQQVNGLLKTCLELVERGLKSGCWRLSRFWTFLSSPFGSTI
jgi:ElaB/YqjD/DUF883 family membrane-anchored ribosome-binding protein